MVLQYYQHLHKHAVYLEPVKQSFQSFIDGIADDSIILLVWFIVMSSAVVWLSSVVCFRYCCIAHVNFACIDYIELALSTH